MPHMHSSNSSTGFDPTVTVNVETTDVQDRQLSSGNVGALQDTEAEEQFGDPSNSRPPANDNDNANHAEQSTFDSPSIALSAQDAVGPAEVSGAASDITTSRPISPPMQRTEGSSEIEAAMLAVAAARAGVDVEVETDDYHPGNDHASSTPGHSSKERSAEQIHSAESPCPVSPASTERPLNTQWQDGVVAPGPDAVATIEEPTVPSQGLHLEGIEGLYRQAHNTHCLLTTVSSVLADVEKDMDVDADMDFVSRCSTPLTDLTSDVDEVESDYEDTNQKEADMAVDTTPKGKKSAKTSVKGKKAVNQRTPKRKGKGNVVAEQGVDSPSLGGNVDEAEERSGSLRPPPMSPAVRPTTSESPIMPVNILQQSEFSPRSGRTRLTRSSNRREATIVPKSEVVTTDVTRNLNDQPTARKSARRAANSESAQAGSATVAIVSTEQPPVKLPTSRSNNREPGVLNTDDTAEVPKPKRATSSKFHTMVREVRQPDGTWLPAEPEPNEEIANRPMESEDSYITQSGRIVKRRDPSLVSSTVAPKRTGNNLHIVDAVIKTTSNARSRATSSKRKSPKPDQSLGKPGRATQTTEQHPSRDGSANGVGIQHESVVSRPEIPSVEHEASPEAPLSSQVATTETMHRAESGVSPAVMFSHNAGGRGSDPEMIAGSIASHRIPDFASTDSNSASSRSKGKQAANRLASPEQPQQSLTNGAVSDNGPGQVSGTGQRVPTRPTDSSMESQLHHLRNHQNALLSRTLEHQQFLAAGFQSLATRNLAMEAENRAMAAKSQAMAAENQSMAAQIQALIARNEAMMNGLRQDLSFNGFDVSRIPEQQFSHVGSSGVTKVQKGARQRTALATTKTKDAEQRQGPKKRKADRSAEGDIDFPGMWSIGLTSIDSSQGSTPFIAFQKHQLIRNPGKRPGQQRRNCLWTNSASQSELGQIEESRIVSLSDIDTASSAHALLLAFAGMVSEGYDREQERHRELRMYTAYRL